MNLFNQLFNRNTISPLMRRNDINYEVKYQTEILESRGFEIISTIEKEKYSLIQYRHFYEETPKEEEKMIFLGIRIITSKGIQRPDPVLKAFFNENFTNISLADIEIEEHLTSHGYGSILLNTLIKIAKERNINSIAGWISKVDSDHLERLVHFYKKHNFTVDLFGDKRDNLRIGNLEWKNV